MCITYIQMKLHFMVNMQNDLGIVCGHVNTPSYGKMSALDLGSHVGKL